jgi:hypothetical protein
LVAIAPVTSPLRKVYSGVQVGNDGAVVVAQQLAEVLGGLGGAGQVQLLDRAAPGLDVLTRCRLRPIDGTDSTNPEEVTIPALTA